MSRLRHPAHALRVPDGRRRVLDRPAETLALGVSDAQHLRTVDRHAFAPSLRLGSPLAAGPVDGGIAGMPYRTRRSPRRYRRRGEQSDRSVPRRRSCARAPGRVRRFPEGTKTAPDAARAIGCEVGQIVKSLVFLADGEPVLALTSGANRVDERRLATLAGASGAGGRPQRRRGRPPASPWAGRPVRPSGTRPDLPGPGSAGLRGGLGGGGGPDAVFRTTPGELRGTAGALVADLKETHPGDRKGAPNR